MIKHAMRFLLLFAALTPALAQEARPPVTPMPAPAPGAITVRGGRPERGDAPVPPSFERPEPGFGPEPFGFGPPRRGRGGPIGGGMMGGNGMGGGGFGGGGFGGFGRSRSPVRRWQDADQKLREYQSKYEGIATRRQKLLNELVAAKKDYVPEKIDPAAVLAQKNMDKILGALHQTVEEARTNNEEAGELLAGVLLTRDLWEAQLRREPAHEDSAGQATPDAGQKERKAAWLKGLERMEKDGPEGFAREVLGEAFGAEAFQAIPERLKRPGLTMFHHSEGGPGGPMRRQLLDNIRQNWLGRIERMERQQEELARDLQRQAKEIEQMRLIMENVLDEPGPEGEPSPPGAPHPAGPTGGQPQTAPAEPGPGSR